MLLGCHANRTGPQMCPELLKQAQITLSRFCGRCQDDCTIHEQIGIGSLGAVLFTARHWMAANKADICTYSGENFPFGASGIGNQAIAAGRLVHLGGQTGNLFYRSRNNRKGNSLDPLPQIGCPLCDRISLARSVEIVLVRIDSNDGLDKLAFAEGQANRPTDQAYADEGHFIKQNFCGHPDTCCFEEGLERACYHIGVAFSASAHIVRG